MKLLFFLMWTLFVFLYNDSAFAFTKVQVTAQRVNLRAGPNLKSESVAHVSSGDTLVAVGDINSDWVEVDVPSDVDLWVYGELVKDSVVAVSKLRVRTGPGINYASVGTLDHDVSVQVRGSFSEWLKIAPPSGCHLWVSSEYVKPLTPEVEPEPVGKKVVPQSVKSPVVRRSYVKINQPPLPVKSHTLIKQSAPLAYHLDANRKSYNLDNVPLQYDDNGLPAVLQGKRMISSKVQGQDVTYKGILRPAGFVWRRPSKYRIVSRDENNRAITSCYLLGREAQIEPLLNTDVTVTGAEYWIQGVKCSVVVPSLIVLDK